MLTRRRFIALSAAFAVAPELRAGEFDLLIKGGRVIDPASGIDRIARRRHS